MRRVNLNFVSRKSTYWLAETSIFVWMIFGFLILIILSGIVKLVFIHSALTYARTELNRMQQISFPNLVTSGQSKNISLTNEQLNLFNRVVRQLNQPWIRLLDELERSKTPHIALLDLNFDPVVLRLSGTAEARNFRSMVTFVDRLGSNVNFQRAQLVNHYVDNTVPAAPVRFEFTVDWNEDSP